MDKILLIDDDVELVEMLKEYIDLEGFSASTAHDGEAGLQVLQADTYDLVVLDVMMPKLNGIDTLRRIRQNSNMPVIMLTAKGDDADRIVGLEMGADDYVPKPCTPRELVARIRAILRRAKPQASHAKTITLNELTLMPEQRRVEWAGEPLVLTSTEFNLLEVLVERAGNVVSKQMLSELALGRPMAKFDRNIDVHMSSVRQKLTAAAGGKQLIQTVYRLGYQYLK
ncbi:response regulator transcription factor [Methylotenera versatilis]|uniref:response regulator transcription factor n=1 Tax=Methylotenera versatilis TaxID=1055487 RepID=UPI00064814DE|nr:response regulator transcription factor [Methylotenera versatilis]